MCFNAPQPYMNFGCFQAMGGFNLGMNFSMGGIFSPAITPNPFMSGSIFSCQTPFLNFGNFSNPFIIFNNFTSNPFAGGLFPFIPFQMPSFSFTSTTTVQHNGKDNDQKISTKSKIKPGLLKGNLKGKEAYITYLCQKYKVDVGVAVSIICQESRYGTSDLARHNNFMGYRAAGDAGKSKDGYGYFSTPEKGLEAGIKNLASYPQRFKKQGVKKVDFDNIDAIGKIYCEGGTYAKEIRRIYNTNVKKYLV